MRVPISWLNDYLPTKFTARKAAEALEQAGIEVEEIIERLPLDELIVVAEVLQVKPHPNADRLRLVELSTGKAKHHVVCGAPNVAKGQLVVLALPGAKLPDGTEITAATIRGEGSNGMICSQIELGLGDDHEGILVLEPGFPLGKALSSLWPADAVIDVSTHANRPDLLSVIGLAREIVAITGGQLKLPKVPELSTKPQGEVKVEIINQDKASRYLAAKLKLKGHGTSPGWLQERLRRVGVRPISLVVDITNYVMLECGQPLHAFDASKVKGAINVRLARTGEALKTLDGVERKLTGQDLIIADAKGPVALAGVMGGEGTAVTDKTTEVIIEAATFDGATVRRMATRHGLRTDASARFERQLPVQAAPVALARVTSLLEQLAGAKLTGSVSDQLLVWPWIQHIGVRPSQVSKLLGFEVSAPTIVVKLKALGFEAEKFDIVAEAKKHLGKPYKLGASFKQDGLEAFDCSYLTDYIYSLIGVSIGYTAHQQFKTGESVQVSDLKPGDNLFRGGSWGTYPEDWHRTEKEREGVAHNYLYVGDGKVINAKSMERDSQGEWVEAKKQEVLVEPVEVVVNDPQFFGTRRYVDNLDDYVAVTVPWWRPDVRLEEDVIEEIVRMVGYDKVPARLPVWRAQSVNFDKFWQPVWRAKSVLKALGLMEVNTYSFVSQEQIQDAGLKPTDHLKLKNPMSREQAYLRSSLLPSLLTAASRNAKTKDSFGFYELSKVFLPKKGDLPSEPNQLAVIVKAKSAYPGVKAALDALAREFNLKPALKPKSDKVFHPARAAEVWVEGKKVGFIGQLHPDVVARAKIGTSVGYLELNFDLILAASQPKHYQPLSRYPAITRDVSLVVKQSVTWDVVEQVIARSSQATASYVGEYTGEGVESGYKSLTIRFAMSEMDRTMTDEDADGQVDKIIRVLKSQFKAEIR